MVRAAVTELELVRLSPHREGKNLMSEADPQHGNLAEKLRRLLVRADHRGGIPGTVGEHHPVRLLRQDLRRRRPRGDHADAAADVDELAEDAALHAVVHHDDVALGRLRIAAGQPLRPIIRLLARYLAGEVLPLHPRKAPGTLHQRLRRRSGRIDHALRAAAA